MGLAITPPAFKDQLYADCAQCQEGRILLAYWDEELENYIYLKPSLEASPLLCAGCLGSSASLANDPFDLPSDLSSLSS